MFSIGEYVVYGSTGVCKIQSIEAKDVCGCEKDYYVLKPEYTIGSTVYAPVQNTPVAMRQLLSAEEAMALIDSIPEMDELSLAKDRQELSQMYHSVLKSTDCTRLAQLVLTLYRKHRKATASKRGYSAAEKDIFNTAERVLLGELSVSLAVPIETVNTYIQQRIGKPIAS